jgi:Ca-activated chloride channel homolog
VSFREPFLLAGLLLVPLALAAYVLAQRRRQRFAVRYTNLDLLATVARRDWLRHVPAALALLALAALLIALARPERVVADERKQATVVMVTDTSGSMKATDVAPDRLRAAQSAAKSLTDKLPSDFKLGLVTFGSTADQLVAPTDDKQAVVRAIEGLRVHGATAMGDGLSLALSAAQARIPRAVRPPAAIVLLSDGKTTTGRDPVEVARTAGKLHIPIFTVALGTADATVPNPGLGPPLLPVPPDPETLAEIAKVSGGRAFTAEDSGRLSSIYRALGSQLGTKNEKREVSSSFALIGLGLLLGGAALGVRTRGRLP